MKKLVVLLLLILTSCQFNHHQTGIKAQVNKVLSGQSIEVIINDSLVKVRLLGINAPDLKQSPWGEEAKQKLRQLLLEETSNKSIILETDIEKKDRYGRIQAYIWKDEILVNEKLIAQGYVLADLTYTNDQYQYTKRLRYAQDYARIMGYGVWNPVKPMGVSPQEFRQQTQK